MVILGTGLGVGLGVGLKSNDDKDSEDGKNGTIFAFSRQQF